MKRTAKMAAVFVTLLLSALLCACGNNSSNNKTVSADSSIVSANESDMSSSASEKESTSGISQESSSEPEASNEKNVSGSASDVSEASPDESSEASDPDKVPSDAGSEASADENSDASVSEELSEESGEISQDSQGYYFDDEQIVTDYHEAEYFTDDEKFNALFEKNEIDKAYNDELREIEDTLDMRNTTIKYAQIWKDEQAEAYQKLYDMLAELPEEQEKLVSSQQNWLGELDEIEAGFQSEASGSGTYGLLAADSAMLNYYKGRAAILYYQIYLLNGSFDMNGSTA